MPTIEQLFAEVVRVVIREELAPLRLEFERISAKEYPVSIREAALRLGVTVRSVQRWIKDRRLPFIQVGGVRMVMWPPRG